MTARNRKPANIAKRRTLPAPLTRRELVKARLVHERQRAAQYAASGASGRPSELTPALQRLICRHIVTGLPLEQSALVSGISLGTFYEWKRRGREGEPPYSEFLHAIQKADAQAMSGFIQEFRRASKGQWSAKLAYLERRWPRVFGARFNQGQGLEPPVPPESGKKVDYDALSDAELEQLDIDTASLLERLEKFAVIEGQGKRVPNDGQLS